MKRNPSFQKGAWLLTELLLLAALGWWLWRPAMAPSKMAHVDQFSFAALQPDRPPAQVSISAPAADDLTLRSQRDWALDTTVPLHDRLATLRALAGQGDVQAACWLALEYSHCHTLVVIDNVGQNFSTLLEHRPLPGVSAQQEDDLLLGIADARERHAGSAGHCREISEFEDNPGVPLLQQLADRGSVRIKVVTALMQPNGSLLRLPRDAVIPLALDTSTERIASQFYADHALDYLRLGFQANDPLALEGLILVYAPDVIHLPNNADVAFRLPNPRLFSALALLAEQVYGGDMLGPQARNLLQRTLESMDVSERAMVERDVHLEAARWRHAQALSVDRSGLDYGDLCR